MSEQAVKPYIRSPFYHETDKMGIIHHSNYIRWLEEARIDFMDQIGFGYKRTEDEGIMIPVLSVSCRYHSMVRFGDTVAIYMAITELTGARMTIVYRILDAASGELRTTGESSHCFLGASGRPVSAKKALPEMYRLFEANKSGTLALLD
ncbi:acyl-CoA thioesterase [Ruminococcaceae bacterium OttesenSCG-928-L11]|nr:acyl-CoA thioesterase [Ruminococcaceae bacterium OttesenSCG-928-L11]